ncbi:MAG: SDR family oxidoreductase [Proteobacteria bacterium]|nr:SDR family oxidoreductase [Pseudomonadota bacterium]
MDLGLKGQTALISGASKGIGLSIAKSLAAEGMKLSITGRNETSLQEAKAKLAEEFGVECIAFAGDMADTDFVESWVTDTAAHFGRMDVLVNNAGSPPAGSFMAQSDDVWRSSFELKPFSYLRAARIAFPFLKERRGRVLNIIGIAGHQPFANFMIGGAADAALMNFTKGFADEIAKDGVRVNSISPGFTKTERWPEILVNVGRMNGVDPKAAEELLISGMPMGRVAEMSEIAKAAVFLISDMSSYITGITLPVDGGATRAV